MKLPLDTVISTDVSGVFVGLKEDGLDVGFSDVGFDKGMADVGFDVDGVLVVGELGVLVLEEGELAVLDLGGWLLGELFLAAFALCGCCVLIEFFFAFVLLLSWFSSDFCRWWAGK